MTYELWMEELTELFAGSEYTAEGSGWVWLSVYEEGLSPSEAFSEYMLTF